MIAREDVYLGKKSHRRPISEALHFLQQSRYHTDDNKIEIGENSFPDVHTAVPLQTLEINLAKSNYQDSRG